MKPTLKAPEYKRLKLKHYNPLSRFAFNFNLRRYISDSCTSAALANMSSSGNPAAAHAVGQCRLTVSKPVLKAPMVSALETIISFTAFKLCFQILLAPLRRGRRRVALRGRAVQVDSFKPHVESAYGFSA